MTGALTSGDSRRSFVFLAAGLCGVIRVFGQKPDPFIGTWLIDSTKSEFIPGPAPANRKMTISAVNNGLRIVVADFGGFFDEKTDSVILFDGMDHPADPVLPVDTYSIKRINANTIERTGKIRGNTVEMATFAISADGKTLTVTTKGSIRGSDYSSTQVFIKQ
jgi:hypothetical protein